MGLYCKFSEYQLKLFFQTHVIMAYALLGYVDTTKSIVQLTKNLFHEWSKKVGLSLKKNMEMWTC